MTLQGPYQFFEKKEHLCVRGKVGKEEWTYRVDPERAYDMLTSRTDSLWLSSTIHPGQEAERLLAMCYDTQQLWRMKYGVLLPDGKHSLIRKYAGYDAAVIDVIAGAEVNIDHTLPDRNTHPAAAAARFLVANGCELNSVTHFIRWLGNVPVAFALSVHDRNVEYDVASNVVSNTINNHCGFSHGFCQYIEPRMLRSVVDWFSGEEVSDERVRFLASRAWLRSRKPEGVGSDFLYNAVRMNSIPAHGVCLAIVLATRLLFAGWLSCQYHPDMFDDMIFAHVTTRETYSQAFRKV